MDAATFAKELAKYKTNVRKADHYEIKFKKDRNQQKKSAPILARPHVEVKKETATSVAPKKSVSSDADFWTQISNPPSKAGLTQNEWNRFLIAMKESHNSMLQIMNLEDLEFLATPESAR